MPGGTKGNHCLGRRGQDLARRFLEASGYEIEAENYHCRIGEIDIVARQGGQLVFVEVKTRTSKQAGDPLEAVDRHKAGRLVKAAMHYIRRNRRATASNVRFDIVAVRYTGEGPKLEHIPNAFGSDYCRGPYYWY